MQFHFSRTAVRQTKDRKRRLRGMALLAALFLTLISLSHLGAMPAFAIPPEPIGEPRDNDPYVPPSGGFDWSRPSRVALAYNAWTPDTFNPYVAGHYNQSYVNPTSFSVRFDGCTTATEERNGTSTNTYVWTLKGATSTNHNCRFIDSFPAQGTFPVSLKVTDSAGTVLTDSTQNVVIKDLMIVAMGDSYASGEGAPDVPQQINIGGGGTYELVSPVVWWDARCHRSMLSPSAQAAWALEKANPQISVTYISFACSGATINTMFYSDGDTSPFTPYMPTGALRPKGTGILGPYAGAVSPHGDDTQIDQIPSQISQLVSTMTANGASRPIDALIIDGGGNDINFGGIASLCAEYYQCPAHPVNSPSSGGFRQLRDQVQSDLAKLPNLYKQMADAITATSLPIANTYIVEYPDSTRGDNGQFCGKMLDDVIPSYLAPVLAIFASNAGAPPPLPPYQIDRDNYSADDEVAWAGGTVFPGLDAAVIAAAQANHWTLVDGIADSVGSPFVGHGYCASDNWIRTASEATMMQGPLPVLPWLNNGTKGTLHPTAQGYQVIAGRIFSKLYPDLFPNPGPQPIPPTFNAPDFSQSVKGSNGWLTGHVSGVACPAGVANCALETEAVSVDASTSIAGTGLSINGVATNCPSAPALVNGVVCSMQSADLQHVVWSFAFPNDGVIRLEFSVSARNGATSSTSQEVKVDLNNPTVSSSLSAQTPASGWFTAPVTPTLSGADGTGSGIQNVQYTLDGGSQQTVNGNLVSVPLATDGTHTFSYQAKDFAGRQSGAQSLTVKIDQTAPVVTCGTPDGQWHANDVSISCSANDNGGSGVSATDANFTLMTSVAANTETNSAATGNRTVCDIAGNCAQQTGPINANKVDKKAPAITLTNPISTSYLLNQSAAASYTCADGGSGVATCAGPVANNAAIDTSSLGSKTFTVTATDAVGNTSSKAVTYLVGYNVCALFDQTKSYKLGSTVPIKLQLCNMQNANLSSASVLPVATGLTQKDNTASTTVADSGNANPDNAFRFDATLNAYIYNLSTKGLATGTWALNFTIPGDPTSHSVQFDVR